MIAEDTSAAPLDAGPARPRGAARTRYAKRQRGGASAPATRYEVLAPVLLMAVACGALVGLGKVERAAQVMWGLLGLFSAWFALRGRVESLMAFLIGAAPFINLLRGALFYSGLPIVVVGVVLWWLVADQRRASGTLSRNYLAAALLGMAALYYLVSFGMTGKFRTNLRVFELACPVVFVVALGQDPRRLRQALWGLLISSVIMGMAAYPHVGLFQEMRLGMVAGEQFEIGNPFSLGMPLAFGVLALGLDRGQWLGLAGKPAWRLTLLLPVVVLLALSTSRAGWLAATGGLAVGFYFASRQRLVLLAWCLMIAGVGWGLWHTPAAEPFKMGWDRTFGRGQDLNRASSGRFDQWVIFSHAITDTPKRFLLGYGPGSGPQVQSEFSSRLLDIGMRMGQGMQFHGLIMQVGIDFGLLGLFPLVTWLGLVGWKCYWNCRVRGLFFPIATFTGYFLATLTASGFDAVSGVLAGLSLSATAIPASGTREEPRSRWRHPKYRQDEPHGPL